LKSVSVPDAGICHNPFILETRFNPQADRLLDRTGEPITCQFLDRQAAGEIRLRFLA
jgi:hypothetical protein